MTADHSIEQTRDNTYAIDQTADQANDQNIAQRTDNTIQRTDNTKTTYQNLTSMDNRTNLDEQQQLLEMAVKKNCSFLI
ncbi:hypothetical protein FF38_08865 [Lucilia cuprina]|uniref:Uncharacterized protein n=1 Tax=Lucilia cuprina TaxID=7375 RepID=A0A0L0BQS6_LUCCU|nr:hypothetical protein FF38_08865 [Lucilia cuprina]